MSLIEYIESLKDKRVTVIGAGISNRPLIRLLCAHGVSVTVCDRSDKLHPELEGLALAAQFGEHYLDKLDADIIFRTPGLHPDVPALKNAREKGALVTSEMEVFLSLCPCRIIAVTGSDGKTTTTTLVSELLRAAGYTVHLGGNIGKPLLCETDSMQAEDFAVLELSSFQLHSMHCAPDIAVITNISPNHLDVHPDYQDYIDAKKQVFLNQKSTGKLVLNADNEVTAACAKEARGDVLYFSRRTKPENGFFLDSDGNIHFVRDGQNNFVMAAKEIRIPGVHNIENMMAAFSAVSGLVSPGVMVQVAKTFRGVAHRLEPVRTLHGVTYLNDSIASSPSRTIAGLECFDKKLILIAGGKDKGVSFESLGEVICRHVKSLYLTGLTAEKIRQATVSAPNYREGAPVIHIIDDFRQTVEAAAAEATDGDIVLLSPASTSFDRFRNFEERGNTFRKIVEELV